MQNGNKYVCDIRIWRNQWSEDGYSWQWSDLIKTCLYDSTESIQIGSIVEYQDTKGKVVNLRQIPIKETLKLETVKLKPNECKNTKTLFQKIFKSK